MTRSPFSLFLLVQFDTPHKNVPFGEHNEIPFYVPLIHQYKV
jgi:hypothetical protein